MRRTRQIEETGSVMVGKFSNQVARKACVKSS